ncbi:MAG: permease [Firmicutes bacterium]|nr:permease [Bacillota bacterium]
MPIKTAFLTFPILALVFTLPFLIYQFRKYKYVNRLRAFILYSMLLYLLVSFYLVILPLPANRDTSSLMNGSIQYFQLRPFNFISEIGRSNTISLGDFNSYIGLMKKSVFFQAAFNGILLLPLGVYLRYYFKKGLVESVITVFLVSLFFEVTQLTGLYTIYNYPYRVFDVDDLILNTFGGLLGYIISPAFTFFLPKSDNLDKNVDLKEMKVGYVRRFIAFLVDWFLIIFVISFVPIEKEYMIFVYALVVFVYFIVITYFTRGKTLGKSLVKIKVKGNNDKLFFIRLFVRYSFLYYGFFGLNYLLIKGLAFMNDGIIKILLLSFIILVNIVFMVHGVLKLAEKDNRLFYERISNTKNVIEVDNKRKEVT